MRNDLGIYFMNYYLKFYLTVMVLTSFFVSTVFANGIDDIEEKHEKRRQLANNATYKNGMPQNVKAINQLSGSIESILVQKPSDRRAEKYEVQSVLAAVSAERLIAQHQDFANRKNLLNPYTALVSEHKEQLYRDHYRVLELMYDYAGERILDKIHKRDGRISSISTELARLTVLNEHDILSCVESAFIEHWLMFDLYDLDGKDNVDEILKGTLSQITIAVQASAVLPSVGQSL